MPSQCDDESKVAVAALSDDGDEPGRLSSCGLKCPQTHTLGPAHRHISKEHTEAVIYGSDVRAGRECVLTLGRTAQN